MSDVRSDIESIERWLSEIYLSCTSSENNLVSKEAKKRLIATNKAIKQLESLGVTVPAELQMQQIKLSAQESQPAVDSQHGINIDTIDTVISSLHNLLSKAKSIRQNLSNPTREIKIKGSTKQYFGVSMSDLIKNGVIRVGTKLELQWRRNGIILQGNILENGHIEVLTSSGWTEYKSVSTAASQIAGCALNGWKHWKVIESDGSRISLEKVRDRFLEKSLFIGNDTNRSEVYLRIPQNSPISDNSVSDEIKI